MAKSLKDIKVLDEQGNEVSNDELEDFLSDTDIVRYDVEKNGKTRRFAILIDNSQVTMQMVTGYQRRMAELTVSGEERGNEIEARQEAEIQALIATGKTREEAENLIEDSPADVLALGEFGQDVAKADALLLCNLVVESNYPGKDFSKPETLLERTGAGPAARKALKRYFFGGLTEPEEETGETPTAPIENASDTSEATDNSAATPPTS